MSEIGTVLLENHRPPEYETPPQQVIAASVISTEQLHEVVYGSAEQSTTRHEHDASTTTLAKIVGSVALGLATLSAGAVYLFGTGTANNTPDSYHSTGAEVTMVIPPQALMTPPPIR